MNRAIASLVLVTMASAISSIAQAEDVSSFIDNQRDIEKLQHQVDSLELQLKKSQLQEKIANVGKSDADNNASKDEQPAQSQTYFNPNVPFGPGSQKKEMTESEKLEQRKDRALDDLIISAVTESSNDGQLEAELVSAKGGSIIVVSKGDKIGNWRIKDISLSSVTAHHVKRDETKLIRRGTDF